MARELQIDYAGAVAFGRRLVQRLEATGATVRWEEPPDVPGDTVGQQPIEVTLIVKGDEDQVRHAISRFREYYPKGRVRLTERDVA